MYRGYKLHLYKNNCRNIFGGNGVGVGGVRNGVLLLLLLTLRE
jgi:hypothetical protein